MTPVTWEPPARYQQGSQPGHQILLGSHCKLAAEGLVSHSHDQRRHQEEHRQLDGPATALAKGKKLAAARQQVPVNLRADESTERSRTARSALIVKLDGW